MFYTIKRDVIEELVEKKSKFIANMFSVNNVNEAEMRIKEIKKKYYDAKHHCFAYITFNEKGEQIQKYSDDGEPSGTAGAPMLELLKGKSLCNIVVIVTRYFGGILLGTGGLVRAYSGVTKLAIEKSEIIEKREGKEIKVVLEYSDTKTFKYYCEKNKINILKEEYLDKVTFFIEIENEKFEDLKNSIDNFSLKVIELEIIREKYI